MRWFFNLADGSLESMVQCGNIDEALTTVDFGDEDTLEQVKSNFDLQDKYSHGGPHVNSEFYT